MNLDTRRSRFKYRSSSPVGISQKFEGDIREVIDNQDWCGIAEVIVTAPDNIKVPILIKKHKVNGVNTVITMDTW